MKSFALKAKLDINVLFFAHKLILFCSLFKECLVTISMLFHGALLLQEQEEKRKQKNPVLFIPEATWKEVEKEKVRKMEIDQYLEYSKYGTKKA